MSYDMKSWLRVWDEAGFKGYKRRIELTLSVSMAESSHLEVLSYNNSPEGSNCGSGGLY